MKQIVIDTSDGIDKYALLEDSKLTRLIAERRENTSLIGNIYRGIVAVVLPSGFAFVDIGLKKNAFLHLTDPREQKYTQLGNSKIKRGDRINVQVLKDPTGDKGAYVTTDISFAGEYLVLFKSAAHDISVSKKVEDSALRANLKAAVAPNLPSGYGCIIRTEAAAASSDLINEELQALLESFTDFEREAAHAKPKTPIWVSTPALRAVKSLLTRDITSVTTDNPAHVPELAPYLNPRDIPIWVTPPKTRAFDTHGIFTQLGKLTQKRVNLPNGAFILIEETEAAAIIDVNSGSYSKGFDHEQTALDVNLAAALEIPRQILLRNLSGIIIIDFIDMKSPQSRAKLFTQLGDLLKDDPNSPQLQPESVLGLLFITRKKSREPLSKILNSHPNGQ